MFKFHLVTVFLFALSCSQISSANTFSFVLGQDLSQNSTPFLAQTHDQGQSWAIQNIPEPKPESILFTATCGNGFCIAAGGDFEESNEPLFLQTIDNGLSWASVTLPQSLENATFYSSSCSESVCVVSGGDVSSPLLVQTHDQGETWLHSDITPLVPQGLIIDVNCIGSYCAAVGNDGFHPILIHTQNAGKDWSKVPLPKSIKGMLVSIDCSTDQCAAIGYEQLPYSDHTTPLVFVSDNQRSIWTQKIITGKIRSGGLYDVKCSDSTCTAVGFDQKYNMSIAGNSEINGTWSYHAIDNQTSRTGFLSSIDCNDIQCFAVGASELSPYGEIVILSNITGAWQSVTPTSHLPSGALSRISCDNTFCYASGQANDDSPLLLQSIHDGSWQVVNVEGAPSKGYFMGGGSTANKAFTFTIR